MSPMSVWDLMNRCDFCRRAAMWRCAECYSRLCHECAHIGGGGHLCLQCKRWRERNRSRKATEKAMRKALMRRRLRAVRDAILRRR